MSVEDNLAQDLLDIYEEMALAAVEGSPKDEAFLAQGEAHAIISNIDPTIHNIPAGGAEGEMLAKASGDDYDVGWIAPRYTYSQDIPSETWVIHHNLNRDIAAVSVQDSAGTVCMGAVQHMDKNTTVLSFGAAFSGKAVLS